MINIIVLAQTKSIHFIVEFHQLIKLCKFLLISESAIYIVKIAFYYGHVDNKNELGMQNNIQNKSRADYILNLLLKIHKIENLIFENIKGRFNTDKYLNIMIQY